MEKELYLHIYALTPLSTLGFWGMWEYVRKDGSERSMETQLFFCSSFQPQFVHADEAKMQSVKENVKMKDRWEMEFSLFKCTWLQHGFFFFLPAHVLAVMAWHVSNIQTDRLHCA